MQAPKNIVICCDGTWCGEATGTFTNIRMLAESFAHTPQGLSSGVGHRNEGTCAHVTYFDGLAASSATGLAEFVLDAALSLTIREKCVEAYKVVVEQYMPGCKIWLFGHSRGAHTVRSVVGMINNCGILRRKGLSEEDLIAACNEVYGIYRNPDELYHPERSFCRSFRTRRSHDPAKMPAPPVRFLGLLDTVGALGVPKLNPGLVAGYEFYDQKVSWQVQTMCHALATHDRLSVFQPTFARRPRLDQKPTNYRDVHSSEDEVWFPGAHYDVGRQRFVFGRDQGFLEAAVHRGLSALNLFSVDYHTPFANATFTWLVKKVQATNERDDLRQLLPEPPAVYIAKYAQDTRPFPSQLSPIQPASVNAYDAFFGATKDLRIFPWLARMLSEIVPVNLGLLQVVLRYQLLGDRHIPLYMWPEAPAAGAGSDGASAANGESGARSFSRFYRLSAVRPEADYARVGHVAFKSASFQRFRLLNEGEIEWVDA